LSGLPPKLHEGMVTSRFQPSFGTSFHVSASLSETLPNFSTCSQASEIGASGKGVARRHDPQILCWESLPTCIYVFTYRQDFLPQGAGAYGGATCSTQFSGIGSGTSGGGCSRFRRYPQDLIGALRTQFSFETWIPDSGGACHASGVGIML
jgi:hypothetical protein